MIIVSIRVQATCVVIVTKPDANAHIDQNVFPVTSPELSTISSTAVSISILVRRSAITAVTPMRVLMAAAMKIVLRTPKIGRSTNPATNVPKIAPARLQAYSFVTERESCPSELSKAEDRTGNVAPMRVVGRSSNKHDKTNRQTLNIKKPG